MDLPSSLSKRKTLFSVSHSNYFRVGNLQGKVAVVRVLQGEVIRRKFKFGAEPIRIIWSFPINIAPGHLPISSEKRGGVVIATDLLSKVRPDPER